MSVELTSYGEKLIEEKRLKRTLRRLLGVDSSWPIFIPVKLYEKNGRTTAIHLLEGYVFIASGLDEIRYFRLENSKIVESVMATSSPSGMRVLEVIRDADIRRLRDQLQKEVSSYLSPGSKVQVTHGVYARLEGEVVDGLEDDPENILVMFSFRSLERISKIPRAFVAVKGDE